MRETPGYIPNPEAKPYSADGTAGGTLWESRTPPNNLWRTPGPSVHAGTRGPFCFCRSAPATRLRKNDWARLVRETLQDGEICVGIRDPEELDAAQAEGLLDLTIWLERNVPPDPTMKFGRGCGDVIVQNDGTLDDFYERLAALARFAGLLVTSRG